MYRKGAQLLISGLGHKCRIHLPYRAAELYDPPSASAVMGAVGYHMSSETEISGKKAKALLDTGASQSIISKDFCGYADQD